MGTKYSNTQEPADGRYTENEGRKLRNAIFICMY